MSGSVGSYRDLMSIAAANSQSKQRELEQRKAQLNKEKRVDPKQAKLKVGVQKFLAKKEEEERRKKEEADSKKKTLMELRNQDRKATNRVKRMINMTKSADKGVLAEAKDCLSQACNEQAGETQPDEDDYGYTSTYANEMYKKMMEKYQSEAKKAPPSYSKFEKIHQLKNQSSSGKESKLNGSHIPTDLENTSAKGKAKPKKAAAPPPPTFEDLMRLAKEKSKEPVVLKKLAKDPVDGFEFGRPMTSRQKKAYLEEEKLKHRVQAIFAGNGVGLPKDTSAKSVPVKGVESASSSTKLKAIPKFTKVTAEKPSKSQESTPIIADSSKREINNNHKSSSSHQSSPTSYSGVKNTRDKPPLEPNKSKPNTLSSTITSQPSGHSDFKKPSVSSSSSSFSKENGPSSYSSSNKTAKPNGYSSKSNGSSPLLAKKHSDFSNNSKQRFVEEEDRRRPPPNNKMLPPSSTSFSKRPPDRIPPRSRPPVDMDRSAPRYRQEMSPSQKKDKPHRGRQVIDSDDEEEDYDSEMDDFIDDSDVPAEDISSMIGQMFGYNKRKYVNEESDDECMESSVEQQMREEARTLRLGVLEDLEDMRMEEEEKKRKALLKKRRMK